MAEESRAAVTVVDGLHPRTTTPSRIVIIGAGIAGLVAGYELLRAGHEVILLEAQQRVGGRILTLREPFTHGLYAEAGAMRIPRTHRMTMAYVEHFGLDAEPSIEESDNPLLYINGHRFHQADAVQNPSLIPGFVDPDWGENVLQRLGAAMDRTVGPALQDPAYWQVLRDRYDSYSFQDFLTEDGWSREGIQALGLVTTLDAVLHISILEVLRLALADRDTDTVRLVGGMDHLPRAFVHPLQNCIQLGAEVVAIDQAPDTVTISYRRGTDISQCTGDFAIITVPFSVLRTIDIRTPFSPGKQRAIRGLYYGAAIKLFLQCRRRFWEDDDGIAGRLTLTDLPIRRMYYPEAGRETGRGVLLASYTWEGDTSFWGGLQPEDRTREAIDQVAQIHPQVRTAYERGTAYVWHEDPFARGATATFLPGQESLLAPHIAEPEGSIHFAGDHTSLLHGWIEGAVESGLRAAQEVAEAAAQRAR